MLMLKSVPGAGRRAMICSMTRRAMPAARGKSSGPGLVYSSDTAMLTHWKNAASMAAATVPE